MLTLAQLIKLVLDESYREIPGKDAVKDAAITKELGVLSASYGDLKNAKRCAIDYSSPVSRFAYIYKYTVAHADYIKQVIHGSKELRSLFDRSDVSVACLGGGPGSDLLGILKYMLRAGAKAFIRTYGFLSSILPFSNGEWEKLSIFLNFLVPKLPAPKEEDLSKGILESIDMDSYRSEVRAELSIALADQNAEIEPAPTTGGGRKPEPELDRLSNIVRSFNEHFGNVEWNDQDKIQKVITEELPAKVSSDRAYQNAMKNSDKQNAKMEHDKALERVMTELVSDHTELFKQFSDNQGFRRWLTDTIFGLTYAAASGAGQLKESA